MVASIAVYLKRQSVQQPQFKSQNQLIHRLGLVIGLKSPPVLTVNRESPGGFPHALGAYCF